MPWAIFRSSLRDFNWCRCWLALQGRRTLREGSVAGASRTFDLSFVQPGNVKNAGAPLHYSKLRDQPNAARLPAPRSLHSFGLLGCDRGNSAFLILGRRREETNSWHRIPAGVWNDLCLSQRGRLSRRYHVCPRHNPTQPRRKAPTWELCVMRCTRLGWRLDSESLPNMPRRSAHQNDRDDKCNQNNEHDSFHNNLKHLRDIEVSAQR